MTLVVSGMVLGRWVYASQLPLFPSENVAMPRIMSGPNAAHLYAAAADALRDESILASEVTLAEQKTAVTRNLDALRLLHEGMRYTYQGDATRWLKTRPANDLNRPVGNFVAQRTLARLVSAEATVQAAEGETERAIFTAVDGIRFGQDISQGPSLIEGMIGVLFQKTATMTASQIAPSLSADAARAAARRLEAMEQSFVPLATMLQGEKAQGIGTLRILAHGETGALDACGISQRLAYVGIVLTYTKRGIYDNYTRAMDTRIQRVSLPYQQARRLSSPTLARDPFSQMMVLPNPQKAHRSVTEVATARRLLLARLAIQAFRAEHDGQNPPDLAWLTEGPNPYLIDLPRDPFSADGDASLRYDPSNGAVWSVGENAIDDGGTGDDDPLRPENVRR